MEIRLPHMPFKFQTPDGLMEVTVRPSNSQPKPGVANRFGAAHPR